MIRTSGGYPGGAMFSYQDRKRFEVIVFWLEEDDPGLTERMRRVIARYHRRRRLLVTAYLTGWALAGLLVLFTDWLTAVPVAAVLLGVLALPGPRRYLRRRFRRGDAAPV